MSDTPTTRHYSSEEIQKLKNLVSHGIETHTKVDAYKDSLKDAVHSVSEELDIPVRELNRVIRFAYKDTLEEEKDKFETVEDILDTIGYRRAE